MTADQKIFYNGREFMVTHGAKQDIETAIEPFLSESKPWEYTIPAATAKDNGPKPGKTKRGKK